MAITGKFFSQRGGARAHPARQAFELSLIMIAQVSSITAEQLVTTDTRQNHSNVASCKFRNKMCGYECRIRYWLIHMPQQTRQQRDHVGLDYDFVMVGAKEIRHATRMGQLIVKRVGAAAI